MKKDCEKVIRSISHITNVLYAMRDITMLGLTKVPEEHGQWAAQTALLILNGVPPSRVPIVPNRKWDIWVNPTLLATVQIQLPKALMQKAKKVY